jgi:hypothetical protein
MANVVVSGGVLSCAHQGQLRLSGGDGRLSVDGNGAVLSGMEVGLSFAPGAPGVITPCPIQSAGGSPAPCAGTVAASSGVSAKLTVGSLGVLLDSAGGNVPNPQLGTATWSVASAGQATLTVDG